MVEGDGEWTLQHRKLIVDVRIIRTALQEVERNVLKDTELAKGVEKADRKFATIRGQETGGRE